MPRVGFEPTAPVFERAKAVPSPFSHAIFKRNMPVDKKSASASFVFLIMNAITPHLSSPPPPPAEEATTPECGEVWTPSNITSNTIRSFSQCVSEMIPEIPPHFYICYAQIVFRKALKDSKGADNR
jgi:hypothetical protein